MQPAARSVLCVLPLAALLAGAAFGQACEHDFCWNHFDYRTQGTFEQIHLVRGARAVSVEIRDTCPDAFTVGFEALEARRTEPRRPGGPALTDVRPSPDVCDAIDLVPLYSCIVGSKTTSVVHAEGTPGYRILLSANNGLQKMGLRLTGDTATQYAMAPGTPDAVAAAERALKRSITAFFRAMHDEPARPCQQIVTDAQALRSDIPLRNRAIAGTGQVGDLPSTAIVLQVNAPSPWVHGFGVGPVVSRLVDPKFGLDTSGNVMRDQAAEDDWDVGVAGFYHLTNTSWNERASLSIGLGSGSSSNLNLFVGPSVRLGDDTPWYVVAGVNVGKVDRLETGQMIGAPPLSATTLSNLQTRTDSAFFVGFSLAFGDDDDDPRSTLLQAYKQVGANPPPAGSTPQPTD